MNLSLSLLNPDYYITHLFCDSIYILSSCKFINDKELLTFDNHHLTQNAAEYT